MEFPGYDLNYAEDCLEASKLNDRFIHRYMKLLDRFAKLPACDELIFAQVKNEFPPEYLASLRDFSFLPPPGDPLFTEDDNFAPEQDDEFFTPPMAPPPTGEIKPPPPPGGASDHEKDAQDSESKSEKSDKQPQTPRNPLQHAEQIANSVHCALYHLMLDWCNIYAMVLPLDLRRPGLQTLVLLGQCIGYITSAADQLSCHQFIMCASLADKCLANCTRVEGLLGKMAGRANTMKQVMAYRLPPLHTAKENLKNFSHICRKVLSGNGFI